MMNKVRFNTFFQESLSNDEDPLYVNLRDETTGIEVIARNFLEELWQQYQPICPDNHFKFLSDAQKNLQPGFWEMYCGVAFLKRGFNLIPAKGDGPDFCVESESKRLWIEAVAPSSGKGRDAVPEIKFGIFQAFPEEKILMRLTAALDEKRKKHSCYLKKGIIHEKEPFIIALNAGAIPRAAKGGIYPFILSTVFPLGPLQIVIDKSTLEVVNEYHQQRDNIFKMNGANVSTKVFLNEEYKHISGVLYSCINPTQHSYMETCKIPFPLGGDFLFVHNPLTINPIPLETFKFCRQYKLNANGMKLDEIQAQT